MDPHCMAVVTIRFWGVMSSSESRFRSSASKSYPLGDEGRSRDPSSSAEAGRDAGTDVSSFPRRASTSSPAGMAGEDNEDDGNEEDIFRF
eukprot:CAMPEP_0113321900 /NCGR_PEP_ID=MMETSP0010_2-20120614/15230_1 /TAXON_ID=216773 ORGANISM="Corethron hystrix, Strain 308" /NCGR_SAMPLE_ID=MMETSP0010_2 /ASSEMBLY_ACC=CAM_ASM_000155 /LENGTH=89 /DNA_ID=CAMNT_0000180187 /DNA_START=16 /DNA_END=285 /DNA_ORIENTATION=+ /assembly_acc=CAM_ASM_000155